MIQLAQGIGGTVMRYIWLALLLPIAGVSTALYLEFMGGFTKGFGEGFTEAFWAAFEGHSGLPSCATPHAQSDAKRAIESAPFAKTNNLTVVAITDPKTIDSSGEKVACRATVALSNATTGSVDYSFAKDSSLPSDQYRVRALLELESFQPHP
jgi:hypothetical protein